MKKKALQNLIALILCLMVFMTTAMAEGILPCIAEPEITAKGAILVDIDTDTILYRKYVDEQCKPASLTKMLTLLVAYDATAGHQDDLVTVTNTMLNVPEGSSLANLVAGDRLSVYDLFYAMMLPSGNDAARTLAITVAGSESAFAELMNAKAAELGMKNSHFSNSHGFEAENHYTTAYDLYLIARAISNRPELVQIFSTVSYKAKIYPKDQTDPVYRTYTNTNTMINPKSGDYVEGVKGIKTGYTSQAGNCLATYYEKDGRRLIVVTVGNREKNRRFIDNSNLINYGIKKVKTIDMVSVLTAGEYIVDVENSSLEDEDNGRLKLYLEPGKNDKLLLTKYTDEAERLQAMSGITVRCPVVTAPVTMGQFVGNVEFVYNNEVIYSVRATAARSVEEEIVSPPDLQPMDIKVKRRFSWNFLSSKSFWIPTAIVIFLIIAFAVFIAVKRREAARVRFRQANIGHSRSGRPGNRLR